MMQARVDACASMAMLLRAYGCVANIELAPGWAMLTPSHRTDNVPEDAIGSWGVWTADGTALMTREDLGCSAAGDDADLTLFQSCLPAYLDPRVAVLVHASCVALGPVFSALLDLEDDAPEHWEIALRVVCWMARERRRLSPRMHLACLSVTVGDATGEMQDMDGYISRFIEGEREKEENK
ncbi:hypothetical protein [Luteococcus peritonei]|uniref:Uncharacterized protein n=1 Tax=Luteococcus peritonei TaxID=88874 RepID=A0ABW4RXZ4_9ACTN